MNPKKLDLAAFEAAIGRSLVYMLAAKQEVDPFFDALTAEERKEGLRPPLRLNEAGRAMTQAAESFPELLAACPTFDGPAVITALEIAERLAPLANQAEAIARLADDTRLKRRGEAYASTLELFRIAKAMAEVNPKLQEVVQPLAEIFAARKAKKEDGTE